MKVLFIFGTRPEGIKCAPLIKELQKDPFFNVEVCNTAQHREMLDEVLAFFNIEATYDLNIMKPNQSLVELTRNLLDMIDLALEKSQPDVVFVQGDTTSAFVGALAAFYRKIPVAHLEAGLRSDDIYHPFPEEANRCFIDTIATLKYTPTAKASVRVQDAIQVGNTIVDALNLALKIIGPSEPEYYKKYKDIDFTKDIILVTTHRRENFGRRLLDITDAVKEISKRNCEIIYSIHPNPNVKDIVFKKLQNHKNIHLYDFINYPEFVWLMSKSYFILSDSGGVQEEAPTLKKPVLVLRDTTERIESVEAGYSYLIGTVKEDILEYAARLFDRDNYNRVAFSSKNPYGDGTTSIKIADHLKYWKP